VAKFGPFYLTAYSSGPLNQRHSIESLNLAIVHCLISLVEVLLNVPLKHSAASIPFVKPMLDFSRAATLITFGFAIWGFLLS
jgi:hypothetical protein